MRIEATVSAAESVSIKTTETTARTELTADVLKKKKKIPKHTKCSKERFLIGQNRTGCKFSRKPSVFKATNNAKTNKSLNFVSPVGFLQKEVDTRRSRSHAHCLLQESNWRQISDLFVLVFFVAVKKRIFSKVPILTSFV